jgi:L-asparaginase
MDGFTLGFNSRASSSEGFSCAKDAARAALGSGMSYAFMTDMMKITFKVSLVAGMVLSLNGLFMAPSSVSAQENQAKQTEQEKPKPNVVILATGGTIAGKQSAPSEYGYTSGAFKVEDLINAVPGIKKLANISGEQVVNIGSQDMNDAVWLKLAKTINDVAKRKDVDGIVVTHGTDTLEETSFFVDLVEKTQKPIVFVGSMRPATAVSADGPANLYDAVAVAADPKAKGRGTLVVLNDTIQLGRDVIKTNTTNVNTFQSPNRGPVGLVNNGKIKWLDNPGDQHMHKAEFNIADVNSLPRVDIIYAHANMSPDLITSAVQHGAKGLVVAGVGDGNMTKEALNALEQAAKQGVVVVRSTRLPEGLVLRNNEVNDDKYGFVASSEYNPPKSRVLLQLSLLETKDPKKIQQMFNVG